MRLATSSLMLLLTVCPVQAHQNRYLTPDEIEELRPILGQPVINDVSIPEGYASMDEVEIPPTQIIHQPRAFPDVKNKDTDPYILMDVVLFIDVEGKVERVDIASAPFEKVATECRQSIMEWNFVPARLNGEPVRSFMRLPVHFKINIKEFEKQYLPEVSTSPPAARSTP